MEMETLWSTFHEPLKAFIVRRTHRQHDVEDILQDVFLKIFTKLDSLRDDEKLRSWIYQITRHSIIDFYRKDKLFAELPDELPETIDSEDLPRVAISKYKVPLAKRAART